MVSKTEDRSHEAMPLHAKNRSASGREFGRDYQDTPDHDQQVSYIHTTSGEQKSLFY
jgi:hypothetical protein